MAAEAASAQGEEAGQGSKSQPVTKLLLQETSLAAFLGHVQIGFSRATDMQGWNRLEQHLESVSHSGNPYSESASHPKTPCTATCFTDLAEGELGILSI